ncbi:MAG TPA: potassium channel family protein [Nocardioidaceae bacterium]|nr:potassium channel family protein [Nocardioidaceae bacterium]
MLSVLLVAVGLALVLLVFVDALTTTLVVAAGAGPLTRRVSRVLWSLLLRVHTRDKPSLMLSAGGTMLLVLTVVTWVVGLWVGWSLVFLGSDQVISSSDRAPASPAGVVYFTGMTIFTLGVGDFVVDSAVWRVLSTVASFTGLTLVTLAITYLVSVVSAVVARRALAIHIIALGDTAEDTVCRVWDGHRFSAVFIQQLISLSAEVATSAALPDHGLDRCGRRRPRATSPAEVGAVDRRRHPGGRRGRVPVRRRTGRGPPH